MKLAVCLSKGAMDQSNVFLYGFKKEVVLVVLMVCDGRFNEMTSVVPKMSVRKVSGTGAAVLTAHAYPAD